tara:strand:+ start:638 stop:847 length:210 start_codon:yes stop_codon:yes gene_type:complete
VPVWLSTLTLVEDVSFRPTDDKGAPASFVLGNVPVILNDPSVESLFTTPVPLALTDVLGYGSPPDNVIV